MRLVHDCKLTAYVQANEECKKCMICSIACRPNEWAVVKLKVQSHAALRLPLLTVSQSLKCVSVEQGVGSIVHGTYQGRADLATKDKVLAGGMKRV